MIRGMFYQIEAIQSYFDLWQARASANKANIHQPFFPSERNSTRVLVTGVVSLSSSLASVERRTSETTLLL
jgi:hypothetical protein